MSLFYPPDESEFHGKTSDKEDMVKCDSWSWRRHAEPSKP